MGRPTTARAPGPSRCSGQAAVLYSCRPYGVGSCSALTGVVVGGTPTRPNVLLVMTLDDQEGDGDLGFHGNPKVRTPNLDRPAR